MTDLMVIKMIWNSVVSTLGAKYGAFDVDNFYLGTSLNEYSWNGPPVDAHTKIIPQ